MNRTDRLYALVEKLTARRARATLRAVQLATSFEVSVRTIERDLLSPSGSRCTRSGHSPVLVVAMASMPT